MAESVTACAVAVHGTAVTGADSFRGTKIQANHEPSPVLHWCRCQRGMMEAPTMQATLRTRYPTACKMQESHTACFSRGVDCCKAMQLRTSPYSSSSSARLQLSASSGSTLSARHAGTAPLLLLVPADAAWADASALLLLAIAGSGIVANMRGMASSSPSESSSRSYADESSAQRLLLPAAGLLLLAAQTSRSSCAQQRR
jgi:hypothetical protein